MASLFKRKNGIWYIVYREGLRRRWLSTKSRSEEVAHREYEEKEKTLERSKYITIREFANEFLLYATATLSAGTCSLYRICFRHFESFFGNKAIRLVTPLDIEKYKAKRAELVSRVRVNIEFRTLRAAFSRAVQWNFISINPFKSCKGLSVPTVAPVYLKKQEFKLLLDSVQDEEFKNLLIFAVSTMMRIGEILSLEWEDVDFEAWTIHIRHKEGFVVKGGRERSIPMSERVFSLLRDKQRLGTRVFANSSGEPQSTRSVSRRFKKLVRRCGLREQIHFHSLRHTGASWLVQEGIPLFAVQNILGHSSPQVTQIYSHLDQRSLKTVVEKISWN